MIMTFETRLRDYRKQLGLSQEKLAEELHISRQAITKWESGAGTPDVVNLMALSDFFQVSIDQLLFGKEANRQSKDFIYESSTEYDIDGEKDFDIQLGGAYQISMQAVESEKVKVKLLSNTLNQLEEHFKIKIDDVKNKIDIDLKRLGDMTEAIAKENLKIAVFLPERYLGKIELAVNCRELILTNICCHRFELSGKVSTITVDGGVGEMEFDSNLDMLIDILSHQGEIALNQLSATSKIQVPKDYLFQAVKKGLATKISYEENGKASDDFSLQDCENVLELNGFKSELVISRNLSD
ncbi:helix-turn-helix domain-containing protein [Streptococcus mutans]|nr:helix-turn-helix domain-containing protein [Streptococcus mutans]